MPFDGTNLTELQQFLIKARTIIEERGWCKYSFKDDRGHVCVLGSFEAVVDELRRKASSRRGLDKGQLSAAEDLFLTVIRIRTKAGSIIARRIMSTVAPIAIKDWNDAKTRRKKHVLAAFDRAIAKAIKNGL